MNRKKIAVLGCTGSVGSSALEGIAKLPEKYEVVSLTANSSINKIKLLAELFRHYGRFGRCFASPWFRL